MKAMLGYNCYRMFANYRAAGLCKHDIKRAHRHEHTCIHTQARAHMHTHDANMHVNT